MPPVSLHSPDHVRSGTENDGSARVDHRVGKAARVAAILTQIELVTRRSMQLTGALGARMTVVAWAGDVVLPPVVPLGIEVSGVWHWNSLTSVDRMWTTVRKARPLLDSLITHVMPLEDVSAAMDLQDAGECGKVLLLPHGEFDDTVAAA